MTRDGIKVGDLIKLHSRCLYSSSLAVVIEANLFDCTISLQMCPADPVAAIYQNIERVVSRSPINKSA